MGRTSEADVRAILNDTPTIAISVFIETAAEMTDYVETCDTTGALSARALRMIETWLSAYYYSILDQPWQEKKTLDASAKFQGTSDLGFDANQYGQAAMRLDTTGCLSRLNDEAKKGGKSKVQFEWLGKVPSEQIDAVDRD